MHEDDNLVWNSITMHFHVFVAVTVCCCFSASHEPTGSVVKSIEHSIMLLQEKSASSTRKTMNQHVHKATCAEVVQDAGWPETKSTALCDDCEAPNMESKMGVCRRSQGCDFATWHHLLLTDAYTVGKRCSLRSTDESNFIKIVVLGLGAPFTATKCAVTLHSHN